MSGLQREAGTLQASPGVSVFKVARTREPHISDKGTRGRALVLFMASLWTSCPG